MTDSPRRYLKTRQRPWAGSLARGLARAGFRPNGISILSIVFAAVSAWAFWKAGSGVNQPLYFFVAAACIQLRLLCNMLDGLLAVEGGFKTKLGDIYNELPDRIADVLILIGAGYSVRFVSVTVGLPMTGSLLGWAAAVFALMTAYVRVLAGSLGAPQRFLGPMAKQHRMAVITAGALIAMIEGMIRDAVFTVTSFSMYVALAVVVAGALITVVRRVMALARDLQSR